MSIKSRVFVDSLFKYFGYLVTLSAVAVLLFLVGHLIYRGFHHLGWEFVDSFTSRNPSKAGIKAGLWGSVWLMVLTAALSFPVGLATALYLEEYALKGAWTKLLEINVANLAGVPSIIFGLLGLTVFVRYFGLDRSLFAGALTLSLLVLPVVVIASQGAIRAVPNELKEAAFALGARKWQVVLLVVLPQALPGVLTGAILALSRAIGETAPLVMVGAVGFIYYIPRHPGDEFTTLPLQIYDWASRPQAGFHDIASAAILVLLLILFFLNLVAVLVRYKMQRFFP